MVQNPTQQQVVQDSYRVEKSIFLLNRYTIYDQVSQNLPPRIKTDQGTDRITVALLQAWLDRSKAVHSNQKLYRSRQAEFATSANSVWLGSGGKKQGIIYMDIGANRLGVI